LRPASCAPASCAPGGRCGHRCESYSRADDAAVLAVERSCLGSARVHRPKPGITRFLYTVFQFAPQVLLPLACPFAPFPLPVGHGDEDVAQQLQMPSLQQGGTRWRPALEEVSRTIKTPLPTCTVVLLSSRLPSPGRCRARSCQWSILTLASEPRPPPTAPCGAVSRLVAPGSLTELSLRPQTPNDMPLSTAACNGCMSLIASAPASVPRCNSQGTDEPGTAGRY